MAKPTEKFPENEPGRYYVDRQCIDCDVCRDIARDNFTRENRKAHSFVYNQPETAEQEALCKEAMEACPVEAIGDNGE